MIQSFGKSIQYEDRRKEGSLPDGLGKLKSSIPWPIDTDTSDIHLSCYFGEVNYSDPMDMTCIHKAVDIQVASGTPVVSPEKVKVLYFDTCDLRGVVDVYLWGLDSHIVYLLCHLDKDSVPEHIRERSWFDRYTDTIVDRGDVIGEVGRWPLELMNFVKIPADVKEVYGLNYHHLHLEMHYYPDEYDLDSARVKKEFNPLLLLEGL